MGKLKKIDLDIPSNDDYLDDDAQNYENQEYDDNYGEEYREDYNQYEETTTIHDDTQNVNNQNYQEPQQEFGKKMDLDIDDNFGDIPAQKEEEFLTDKQKRAAIVNDSDVYSNSLSKIAKTLTSPKEQQMFYAMRLNRNSVNNMVKKRFVMALAVGLIVLVLAPMFKASLPITAGAALIAPIAVWFMAAKNTGSIYKVYKFNRQLNFTKFCRLLIPYLTKMKQGASLYQLLGDVSKRLDDKQDQDLVRSLMIDIANRPGEEQPFLKFAREFSGTDRAELFMLAVFDMSQGAYDDGVVKDLGRQASNDLMKQIDSVVEFKLSKFNNITTFLTMCSAIMLLGYFFSLIVSVIGQAFSKM